MMMTKRKLRDSIVGFLAGREGLSAIEFGLIVPFLTTIVLALADVATIGAGVGEMQTAVRAAIQYAMNGGTDMTVAQTQGTNSWQSEPSDGTLTVTAACYCGSSGSDCQTVCADNTIPKKYVTVTASGTYGGNMISQKKTVTEVVRIR